MKLRQWSKFLRRSFLRERFFADRGKSRMVTIVRTRKHFTTYGRRLNDSDVDSLFRGLRKWISAARQKGTNSTPTPSTVESPGNVQLQKLLAKEEQRLEQEQKRAAIERRRKQHQERFQLQHELNHPLRQHHMQQKTRTLQGISAIVQPLRDITCSASLKRCVMP